jgi:gas vesicle protein
MYGEYEQTRQSTGHEFLSGVLFGAVVGAAVGLLFAPKSGAEIRGQVADSASRMKKQAGQTYERASSVVTEAVDRGRDAWKRGRESFQDTRDSIARETASAIDNQIS